jgi:hypothetical protein
MNTNLNIKIGTKPLLLLWGIKNDLLPVSGILVLPSYSTSWNGSGLRKSWPWNFEPCCVSKLAKTIWICACLPQTSSTHQTSQGHFVKCQSWGTWTPQNKCQKWVHLEITEETPQPHLQKRYDQIWVHRWRKQVPFWKLIVPSSWRRTKPTCTCTTRSGAEGSDSWNKAVHWFLSQSSIVTHMGYRWEASPLYCSILE